MMAVKFRCTGVNICTGSVNKPGKSRMDIVRGGVNSFNVSSESKNG